MPEPEPTHNAVLAEVKALFKHDERMRAVEQELAETRVVVRDMPRMEARIMAAIADVKTVTASAISEIKYDTKPKSVWPVVAGLTAVFTAALAFFAVLYGAR